MRIWITPVLLVAVATLFAGAQPPANPPQDPPPIVIKPRKPGDPPPGTTPTDPKAPPGTIVISPNGKSPIPPATVPGMPVVGGQPIPQPVPPARGEGKSVFDYWYLVAIEGQPIGYLHWEAREVERKDQKFWIGTKYQAFTIRRFDQLISQWGEESTVESPDGEVFTTTVRQGIGPNPGLVLSGIVEGKTLKVRGEGVAAGASDTPWPGGVTGVAREPRLFGQKKYKPGESFEYLSYVGQVNRVVKITVTFEGEEALTLWPNTPPKKLLRFVAKMEKVGGFKLPDATTWCDAETAEPFLTRVDFPMLGGEMTFLRTTKEAATAPLGKVPEIFNVQSIPLDREIPGIHSQGKIVYKLTMPKDDEPGTTFAIDARQEIKNLDAKAKTFELHVSASHGPVKGAAAQPAPGKEYTSGNYFINSEDASVKAHAARIAAGLPANATAWEKARAVELWVHQNMKPMEFSQALDPADVVAKTLRGDCTEFGMLSAALCKALNVPARTALGLVYAQDRRTGKPFLAYHMWFEVYADGQWLPLDATLGQGGIGPGHLKIADQSWHDEKSVAPLLPMIRVLSAKPRAEVLKVNP